MMLTIPGLLEDEQLQAVAAILATAKFQDGRLSAGVAAARVKENEEVDPGSGDVASLNNLVLGTLYRNPVFRAAVLPHRLSGAFYARYRPGMSYGDHIDDPVMGESGGRYRADVAVTVFLNDPAQYDGGELVIRTSFGANEVKLPAGHAVVYPASSLHRVAEVTGGERVVAVAWAQSLVREPARRELLYDLDLIRNTLRNVTPDAEVTARADNVYANLVRMWAEV